jgi:purine-binding chemotaxis protein CheW
MIDGPGTAAGGVGVPASYVAFSSGPQRWALPLATVDRVVAMVAVSPLPGAPHGVRGAIDVHGTVVPVLDLGLRLGEPPHPLRAAAQLVLARTGQRRIALPADEAYGVVEAVTGPAPSPLTGVAATEDGMLVIYDLDAFLSAGEEDELTRALAEVAA